MQRALQVAVQVGCMTQRGGAPEERNPMCDHPAYRTAVRRMLHSQLWQAFNSWMSLVDRHERVGSTLVQVNRILRRMMNRQLSSLFMVGFAAAPRDPLRTGLAPCCSATGYELPVPGDPLTQTCG